MKMRVCSVQYNIKEISQPSDFYEQISNAARLASDYGARFLVLPEYHSLQLLLARKARSGSAVEKILLLAEHRDEYVQKISEMARSNNINIIGGTIPVREGQFVYNESPIATRTGSLGYQRKINLTRFEAEKWEMAGGKTIRVFEVDDIRILVAICYDIEFSEYVRAGIALGAEVIFVPSCTDEINGFTRVSICSRARAIEGQCFVVQSSTVSGVTSDATVGVHYGQSGVYSPADFGFPPHGVVAQGVANQEQLVFADLDLSLIRAVRTGGTVLNFRDGSDASPATSQLLSL